MDDAGVICDWNLQAEATFGWTRDEAIGRRLDETLIPPASVTRTARACTATW